MKHLLETNMEKGMLNYNETGYDGVTHTWDIIQTEVGRYLAESGQSKVGGRKAIKHEYDALCS